MLSFTGLFCLFCKSLLHLDEKRPATVTVYTLNGSFQCHHLVKKFRSKGCNAHFHYSYFTKYHVYYDKNMLAKFYYDDCLKKEYFLSSSSTAFQTEFLRSLYSDMFLCPEYSFYQKSMNFNITVQSGNIMMEPKRLTEAFFQLALLDMWQLFNSAKLLSSLIQSHDVDRNINDIMPSLKDSFRHYYSKHHCDIPGCGVIIGFDADCKVCVFSSKFDAHKSAQMDEMTQYTCSFRFYDRSVHILLGKY